MPLWMVVRVIRSRDVPAALPKLRLVREAQGLL